MFVGKSEGKWAELNESGWKYWKVDKNWLIQMKVDNSYGKLMKLDDNGKKWMQLVKSDWLTN